MNPIYCSECLERIPFEYFKQGKAAWSSGRPYLVEQAKRLGLKLDVKPPLEYADALGFGSLDETVLTPQLFKPFSTPTTKIINVVLQTRREDANGQRCELEIVCESDGYSESHPPVRMDLLKYGSIDKALVLGRDSSFTKLFKTHLRVSRKHCKVWMAEGKVFVQDLHSSNKTFLDGYELEPERHYQFFKNQFLTLGAKHSAIRMTLDASGFPLVESSRNPNQSTGYHQQEEALPTAIYRPITHIHNPMNSVKKEGSGSSASGLRLA